MRNFLKNLLDIPRIKDFLHWETPDRAPSLFSASHGGIVHEDGSRVTVDEIQASFGISRESAEKIAKRGTR